VVPSPDPLHNSRVIVFHSHRGAHHLPLLVAIGAATSTNPFSVGSFLGVLNTGNNPVCVPMQDATISGCTLCGFLAKIGCYLSNKDVIIGLESIELVGEIYGRKLSAVVTPQHGTAANDVLVSLLRTVAAGTIFSRPFRFCRQKRIDERH
jgi:hypothetical protein